MRKYFVIAMAGSVLAVGFTGLASAQTRRDPVYQQDYQFGQFDQRRSGRGQYGGRQEYNQDARRERQYQRGSRQSMANRYEAQRVSGPMSGVSYTDRQLASWLLVDNRGEIQLARLAQERASCDDVKEFAERMVDEHAEMVEQLQQFAGTSQGRRSRRSSNAQPSRDDRHQYTRATNARGGEQYQRAYPSSRGGQSSGEINFSRLKQQLGQQCVASAQRELEQKEGDEFDKCYIGMQLAMHMQMLDTLKVFSRYASAQLDELIEQAEETTEDHLEHAKHLIKQLESEADSGSSQTSDRPSAESRRNRDSEEE